MPADRDKGPVNNPSRGNQHRSVKQHPELPQWIQKYIDDGVKQADMPQASLEEHAATIGLRSIERIVKKHDLRTSRHSGLTDVEKGAAILAITQEDPLT
ncbi:hypothetical protein B0H17DRAFT_1204599 [Mycena rosella]|uniref:Uncharacterized protein n=1 Tax=Mycena rosella TaxID=1033263 RepID=A0AAD7D915_MYCRO|nr:hypothetical protein B0H17DRAFT_1204599 [Mycena rosella]